MKYKWFGFDRHKDELPVDDAVDATIYGLQSIIPISDTLLHDSTAMRKLIQERYMYQSIALRPKDTEKLFPYGRVIIQEEFARGGWIVTAHIEFSTSLFISESNIYRTSDGNLGRKHLEELRLLLEEKMLDWIIRDQK